MKFLEGREYDIITCNKALDKDTSEYRYLSKENFDRLEHFIKEYATVNEDENVLNFLRVGIKKGIGSIISVNNYVGIIQLDNGFQLQILPKIDFINEDSNIDAIKQTKTIFIKMLRSMKDFPSKFFSMANLKMDKMNLYEIFISMYIQEVRLLIKHGIKSAYVTQNEIGRASCRERV